MSRISLAVCRPWRTLSPSRWHCALERVASRSSGVRVTTFSSARRPPPLVRVEEVSAPLERSIRTTRRAQMRPEVEAHALLAAKHLLGMQTSGEGQRGQGRPSAFPRPLQQFGACSRQEAASIDIRQLLHSLDRDATCTQREACNFRQRAPWTASARLLPANHGRITL